MIVAVFERVHDINLLQCLPSNVKRIWAWLPDLIARADRLVSTSNRGLRSDFRDLGELIASTNQAHLTLPQY